MCFRFDVRLLDGFFYALLFEPTGWIHVVLNYIGPNDGQGIRVYYDGTEVASSMTKVAASHSAGDSRIVVGRAYTDKETDQKRDYVSMEIDELIFFNEALSTGDIKLLYNVV